MASGNIYTPLRSSWGQFRIMKLLPGSKMQQISCDLFVDVLPTDASSIAKPTYDALSYEWGPPDRQHHDILLSGQTFRIRDNLFKALLYLRKEKEERKLWVDAICIDQTNVQERNHQVERMSDIYRSADCVHVWLGDEEFDSSVEIEFFDQTLWLTAGELAPGVSSQILMRHSRLRKENYWAAVAALFERTYWSRIWIVQEFLLASEILIHYGPHRISASGFHCLMALAVVILKLRETSLKGDFSARTHSQLVRLENSPGLKISRFRGFGSHYRKRTLIGLLKTCRNSKSSDAHDRVYAILGLADDVPSGAIPIDYDRSIFKLKMDVAWFYHQKLGPARLSMSETCQLLDEIFADCDEEDE